MGADADREDGLARSLQKAEHRAGGVRQGDEGQTFVGEQRASRFVDGERQLHVRQPALGLEAPDRRPDHARRADSLPSPHGLAARQAAGFGEPADGLGRGTG